ncbi:MULTISPECIES: hypothetical protein [unclassified Massilia]|uniref:hypothetical protein n=1 Tax=unclassified Massilia TaxID=2609279 RepID=UPI00177C340F|nr:MULTISPECIES: hypothetical protein [unclassified Massilia]MBD8528649.1 hypothetical protein [Massilia sp. CFBP 13647]MBD8672253.1 hypothetical protein [Massilia sp. CFBP 13721]
MSQNPVFDSSIPVLTEVVLEPALVSPAPPAPAGQAEAEDALAAEPVPEPAQAEEAAAPAPAAVETQAALQALPLPAPDWEELERRIAERVLAQLQPQIDAIVRNALASAGDQIHIGLRQAVEQVVAQQVASIQFGQ